MARLGKPGPAKSPAALPPLTYKPGPIVRDRRAERTRGALLETFRDLLLDGDYDALSVSDIIAAAGIARSTFYEHFEDKDGLLRESMTIVLEPLADAAAGRATPQLLMVVRHFADQSRLARKLFASTTTYRIIVEHLTDLIERRLASDLATGIPRTLFARQIAAGQLGLLEAWLKSKNAPAEAIAGALVRTN